MASSLQFCKFLDSFKKRSKNHISFHNRHQEGSFNLKMMAFSSCTIYNYILYICIMSIGVDAAGKGLCTKTSLGDLSGNLLNIYSMLNRFDTACKGYIRNVSQESAGKPF